MNVPTMASIIEIIPLGLLTSAIETVTKVYYLVFAVITIAGGIMGYVKAKSVVSVFSGSLAGILLIVASSILPQRSLRAYIIGLIVSIMLAGKFVPDFVHKKAIVPGGLMALLSVASIVLTILAMIPR
jgi:uncharacterized membrane protein (UPF0136 family)